MEPTLTALRALAEPTRLRLMALCASGEHTVSELVEVLGQTQPRVSRHLKLLCDAGLLQRLPEGNRVYYRRTADQSKGLRAIADSVLSALPRNDADLSLDRMRLGEMRQRRSAAAAEYFRKNAANWDQIRSLYVDETEVELAVVDMLPEGRDLELVDIGTGTGRILELLNPRVRHGIGVDQSREMLTVARARLDQAGLTNVHVRHGDMYRTPFPDGTADVITVHQVLRYAENPAQVIAEAKRILRPVGRLIIADFAPHSLEQLRHQHSHRRLGFSDAEIAEWAEDAGLTLARVRHLEGDPLTVAVWALDPTHSTDMLGHAGSTPMNFARNSTGSS